MLGEYRFAGQAQEQFQRASPELQARMRRVAATIVGRLDPSPQARSRGTSAETVKGFDVVYRLDVDFPYPHPPRHRAHTRTSPAPTIEPMIDFLLVGATTGTTIVRL